jgi:hypothetical protein
LLRIPHLETDITQACNLSCVGCNHLVPLWRQHGPWQTNRIQLETDLRRLAPVVHADRWGALGGEPTLHRDLSALLQIAQDSGIADAIEVWTNGAFLKRMGPEFWRHTDILVLSIYPGQHTANSLDWIRSKCDDTGTRLEVKDEVGRPNFRTLLEPTPTDPEATAAKFKQCFFRRFSRVANFGHFFTCCCAPHMPLLLRGEKFGTDGIPITEGITEADVRAYLERSEPLGSCASCAGRETAVPLAWHQERDPLRWIAASKGIQ